MGLFCEELYTIHGGLKEGCTDQGTHNADYEKIRYFLDRGKDVVLLFAGRKVMITHVEGGKAAGITADLEGLKYVSMNGSEFWVDSFLDADDYQF